MNIYDKPFTHPFVFLWGLACMSFHAILTTIIGFLSLIALFFTIATGGSNLKPGDNMFEIVVGDIITIVWAVLIWVYDLTGIRFINYLFS